MRQSFKDKSFYQHVQRRKSLGQWLKQEDLGKRWLIGFVMMLSLATFLHFREIRVEILEPGALAKNYVVAQVDFDFLDEDSTLVLRQQALKDLGPILQLEDKQIKDRRQAFDQKLIHQDSWREEVGESTFDEMGKIADQIEDHLYLARFIDQRTLKKIKELHVKIEDYYVLSSTKIKETRLPSPFSLEIHKELIAKKFPEKSIQYAQNFFQEFSWGLEQDLNAQKKFKQIVEGSVPEKVKKIRSGSRIIDQGEKVTPKHIAMLASMKDAMAESRKLFQPLTILGSLLFSFFIVLLGTYYFKCNHKDVLRSTSKLSLYVVIVILTLGFSKISEALLLQNHSGLMEYVRYPLFVPFGAILLTILLGSEIALFTSCFLSVLLGISLAVDLNRFLIVNLILGVVSIIFTRGLRKRKEVFAVCAKVWMCGIPIIFSYNFIRNNFWNMALVGDFLSTLCFMILIAILVIGLLPILESFFQVMTDITLMEYMDPSNDLLRRLSLEAPGTYQHSLVVGTLSEAAAQSIGANGLFCRVSTQYHDIGKLTNPHYFTENQMGGFNIHQLLTPAESSQVIIAHVLDGEALAKKHQLPQSFIDIIREHHGTTLVYYFYAKEVERAGGDVTAVDESFFRYPGPKPKTKESAIIMIADSIEAASRSLEDVSEETLTQMVDRIVADKNEEGQFDDCQLTFEELGLVKKAIVRSLSVTRHLRVKYPERKR